MKINPNDPVFGGTIVNTGKITRGIGSGPQWVTAEAGGLTIRAELAARFAAAWAQAIAVRAHEQPDYIDDCATIEANRLGLLQADALIAELNRDAVTESEATR